MTAGKHQDSFMDLVVVVMKPGGPDTREEYEHIVLVNGTRLMFVPDPMHCMCLN